MAIAGHRHVQMASQTLNDNVSFPLQLFFFPLLSSQTKPKVFGFR